MSPHIFRSAIQNFLSMPATPDFLYKKAELNAALLCFAIFTITCEVTLQFKHYTEEKSANVFLHL